jgi:hypothetical protein
MQAILCVLELLLVAAFIAAMAFAAWMAWVLFRTRR